MILTVLISLTLYARQQFLFLAVFHILILLLNNNKKELIFTILIYSFLSLPGFYVLSIWGVFKDISQATSASGGLSLENMLLNVTKISSLFFFYSIPLVLINFSRFLKIFFSKRCLLIFIIVLFIKYLLFNDINYPLKSGGYIVKFNYFFK